MNFDGENVVLWIDQNNYGSAQNESVTAKFESGNINGLIQ
jgi:hypothetical protein